MPWIGCAPDAPERRRRHPEAIQIWAEMRAAARLAPARLLDDQHRVADEQRVTGEHPVRRRARAVVHDDAERLRRVPGRVQHLEHDLAELDPFTVGQLA